jgi:hypothetical protein
MSAYRSSSGASKPIVTIRVRAKRQVMTTIFMGFFALIPIVFLTFITVECERPAPGDGGTCQVRERGLLIWRSREFPLRELTAVRAKEHVDGDGDTLSQLVLVTTRGELELGRGSDNIDISARRDFAARFATFRQGEGARFDRTTGYGGLGFCAVWLGFCAFFTFVSHGRTVRVVVDPQRGGIYVRRWFRTIALPLSRQVRIAGHGPDSDGDEKWHIISPQQHIKLPANVRPEDVEAFDAALWAATDDPPEGDG